MHWCLLSIAVSAILGLLVRITSRKVSTNEKLHLYVDEWVGNMMSSVFVMELGVVARHYGTYSPALLAFGFLHVFLKLFYFARVGGFMNPLAFLESVYRHGNRSPRTPSLLLFASIVVTQYLALCSGQHLARQVWAYCDHEHVGAIQLACTASVSAAYPWYYSAVCEGVGVFIAVCIDALTPPSLKELSGAGVMMTLHFFLSHTSGSFYNPIFATAFSFRCAGHTSDWQYLVVYWITPAVGLVSALKIIDVVGRVVGGRKVQEKTA